MLHIESEPHINKYQGGKMTATHCIYDDNVLIATIWGEGEFRNTPTPQQKIQDKNVRVMLRALEEEAFELVQTEKEKND